MKSFLSKPRPICLYIRFINTKPACIPKIRPSRQQSKHKSVSRSQNNFLVDPILLKAAIHWTGRFSYLRYSPRDVAGTEAAVRTSPPSLGFCCALFYSPAYSSCVTALIHNTIVCAATEGLGLQQLCESAATQSKLYFTDVKLTQRQDPPS